jgi:hypothetical protein
MSEPRPWYREPFMWMIVGLPLTAVVAGLTTYYIAYKTRDGLVVDDYYQQGKEINKSLARDDAAARLGLTGGLRLDAASQKVVLQLEANHREQLPVSIKLSWLYATRSGLDQTQILHREVDGRYRAEFPELAPGHWYVQIEAQDWRLEGSLRVPSDTGVIFKSPSHAGPPAE